MSITDDAPAGRQPTTVAFTNCFDATTFCRTVNMTADETKLLRGPLAALFEYGFLLHTGIDPAVPGYGYGDIVAHLRASVGAHVVEAALAADNPPPSSEQAPVAVMPVWHFGPEGASEDVLVSSAMLWGVNLLVEALRVEDDDDPAPVPSVRERFDRWAVAAGSARDLSPMHLPGRQGCYVLFAASAPV